jgi:hypothetical protein
VAHSETPAAKIELISAIILGAIGVGSAVAELKFDYRPQGWLPVLGVFLAFFIPTFVLCLTAFYYPGKLTRILTIPLVCVGFVTSVFFLLIWSVLLFCQLFNQIPSPRGEEFASHPGAGIRITQDTLVAEYKFSFQEDADYAEVFIRPDHPDKPRVQQVDVILFTARTQEDKEKFQIEKPTATDLQFNVSQPSRSLIVTARLKIAILSRDIQSPVNLLVSYRYWQQNKWWRIRRWVFREFGPQ